MHLVDIGANLTHQSFEHDFDTVIELAKEAGVDHIIITGTDLTSSKVAAQFAAQMPGYFNSTAGFHPHVADTFGESDLAELTILVQNPAIVAIGETGLDYNRNYSPRTDQLHAFEAHLKLAADSQLPLFLHQRDAHEDFISLLREYRTSVPGGVVHCFTDSTEALHQYLELDMYIGITGWICDERRGMGLRDQVRHIPRNRLLLETDAPYLLPRTLKPKPKSRRNEPRYLIEVLNTVAECIGEDAAIIARETTNNAQVLFGLGDS